MASLPRPYLTPEEYLEYERQAEGRHEYWGGEIHAMSGGSPNHSSLSGNAFAALRDRARSKGCRAFESNLKVYAPAKDGFLYPDAHVVFGALKLYDKVGDAVTNPVLVIEVLSPSTERYDRGVKFAPYRSIPGLREILFVDQEQPAVELFTRCKDSGWQMTEVVGLEGVIHVTTLQCDLPLAELYLDVSFN